MFFHFEGESLEVEAAGPASSQAEKEVVRKGTAAPTDAPPRDVTAFSGCPGTNGRLVPLVSLPFVYSPYPSKSQEKMHWLFDF